MSEYLAIAELGGGSGGGNDTVRLAASLTSAAIQRYLSGEIQERTAVFWAPGSKAVLGRRQRVLGALVLSEVPLKLTDELALPVLIKVSATSFSTLGVLTLA